MMYSWPLLVSMLTMMDLIDGSHSTRTPAGRRVGLMSASLFPRGGGDAYLLWLVLAWCRIGKDHRGGGIRVVEVSEFTGGPEELGVLGLGSWVCFCDDAEVGQ